MSATQRIEVNPQATPPATEMAPVPMASAAPPGLTPVPTPTPAAAAPAPAHGNGHGHNATPLGVVPEGGRPPAPALNVAAAAGNGNGAAAHAEKDGEEDDMGDAATIAAANAIVAAADRKNGMTDAAVEAKRATSGWNETVQEAESAWVLLARKFWGLSPWMLELVIIVSAVLSKWIDLGVVAFLLCFNAALAFREDMKSRAAVEALKQKLQLTARVLRAGEWKGLPARELVPGDVIRLRMGDLVPADARVVQGACGVDQSALTGESTILERPTGGLLFSASLVRRGEVTAVVTAIGGNTFFGKTAKLVDDSNPATHIETVVRQVTKGLMTIVIIALVVGIVVVAATNTDELLDSVSLLLVVLVTAIPVALPAMYTTAMALGSHELVAKGVIVTRLGASEDAASMTVLCSDKTGTLTKNEMTVREIILVGDEQTGTTPASADATAATAAAAKADAKRAYALHLAVLASKLENHDPVDIAIFNACKAAEAKAAEGKAGGAVGEHANYQYRELHFVPFDASIRRTEVILEVTDAAAGGRVIGHLKAMKGAVATLCECAQTPAEAVMQLNQVTATHGGRGWRSMAVAVTDIRSVDDAKSSAETGTVGAPETWTFSGLKVLGVIGMSDEARPDSKAICAELQRLGVSVKMLTGDNVKVARAMAEEVGIPPAIINLDAEKKRLRELLATGHHSIPRRLGQRRPSGMIKTGSRKASVEGHTREPHSPMAVVPSPHIDKLAAAHHDLPAIALDVAPAPTKDGSTAAAPIRVTDEMVQEEMRHTMDFENAAGFAQIFPADKHMIVKALQESGAIVGMTGDGVNDAPALKQAEVGCAVSNATDVAKGAASAVLTHDGLSGIVELVRVGRRIHHRIETWILNKTCRTVGTTAFVVISYLIAGKFVVSAFSMLLMLFLFDFITITIATDNVTDLGAPSKWSVANYMAAAATVGALVGAEDFAFYFIAKIPFDLNDDELNTVGFQLIMYFSLLTTLSVRERRRWWDSRPGGWMSFFIALELFLICLISSIGIPGLEQVEYHINLLCLAFSLVCVFVVNDTVKMHVFRYFNVGGRKDPEPAAVARGHALNAKAVGPLLKPSAAQVAAEHPPAGSQAHAGSVTPVSAAAPSAVDLKTVEVK